MRWTISWHPHADGMTEGNFERCRSKPRLPNNHYFGAVLSNQDGFVI
nr:MAG TPA: hypothetical protein [Caudoviricetes sp.]